MTVRYSIETISRLVNRHLSALVSEARLNGIELEDLTIELAAHASCAALSFWTADDLHGLLDAAAAEINTRADADLSRVEAAGSA